MSDVASLSDEAWAVIEPHLPKGRPGAYRVDDRRVLNGTRHVLRSGCRCRDCPPDFGPTTTIYNRWSAHPKPDVHQTSGSSIRILEPGEGPGLVGWLNTNAGSCSRRGGGGCSMCGSRVAATQSLPLSSPYYIGG